MNAGFIERALYALNSVVLQSRSEAYRGEDHARIASGLDVAEHLVRLIARGDEAEFRRHLRDYQDSHGGSGVSRLDAGSVPEVW